MSGEAGEGGGEGQRAPWELCNTRTVEWLINQGHHDALRYTYDQFVRIFHSAEKRYKQERWEEVGLLIGVIHGEKNLIKEILED
ncbi:MAG: hypothetical protein JXA50_01800 [Deltaproteobacteria bacterium]|nr:hypothetical protein [Deltaproteobacteria bacterium]